LEDKQSLKLELNQNNERVSVDLKMVFPSLFNMEGEKNEEKETTHLGRTFSR